MKVTVSVSNAELNALEDVILVWNLCKKHKAFWNASDDDYWRFTQTCKECKQINKRIRGKALHLWSKLVTAYLKETKKYS